MMLIFELRAKITALYQKYAFWINLAARFVLCYLAFNRMHSVLDYNPTLGKSAILLALSGICAVLPSSLMVIIAAVYVSMQIYASSENSLILTIIVFALFLVFYCFFIRFTPKYGAVVLAVPILQTYGFPYIVPILLGLFGTPVSIVSVCCGVFAYNTLHYAKDNIPYEIPKEEVDMQAIYMDFVKDLIANPAMYVTMLILAVVITVVYFIRRIRMDFAFEISIAVGTGVMILGYIIGDLRYDLGISIAGMVIACLICAGVSLVILFFARTLQYSAAENVEFEDDDYYYYVKAVPKVKAGAPKRKEKKVIRRRRTDDDDEDEYEDAALGLIEYGDNDAGGSPTLRKKKAEAEREREEEEEADEFGDDLSIDDLKPSKRYGTRVGERAGSIAGKRGDEDNVRKAGRGSYVASAPEEDDADDDVIVADSNAGWSRVSSGSRKTAAQPVRKPSTADLDDFEDDDDEEEVIRGYYPGTENKAGTADREAPADDDDEDEEEVIRGYYADQGKDTPKAASAAADEDDYL